MIYFSLLVPPIAYARSSKIEDYRKKKEDQIVQLHIDWLENGYGAQHGCARDCLSHFGELIFINMWKCESTKGNICII